MKVEAMTRPGVSSGDSSTSGPSGPDSRPRRGLGPLSLRGTMGRMPAYRLTCRAPHPDPRRANRGEAHGLEIGGSTVPMRPTGRLLDYVGATTTEGGLIRFAPSCGTCGVATEYEECSEEEAAA